MLCSPACASGGLRGGAGGGERCLVGSIVLSGSIYLNIVVVLIGSIMLIYIVLMVGSICLVGSVSVVNDIPLVDSVSGVDVISRIRSNILIGNTVLVDSIFVVCGISLTGRIVLVNGISLVDTIFGWLRVGSHNEIRYFLVLVVQFSSVNFMQERSRDLWGYSNGLSIQFIISEMSPS
jgi:hypothetical protein